MTSSPNNDRPSNHEADTAQFRGMRLTAASIMLFGASVAALPTPAVASVDKILNETPLVLKDGRIAEVSVHTVPFPENTVAPASKARQELEAFAQNIATDCFLTAQVIGHVGKEETSGRETADIHRLARARADTVHSLLIDSGLPSSSIASVWDWRFMVHQARVTLWVFRLTTGNDCSDQPLGAVPTDQIAAIEAPETASAEEAGTELADAPVPAATGAENTPLTSTEHGTVGAAEPKTASVTTPIPASPSRPAGEADNETVVRAASAPKVKAPEETKVAALDPKAEAAPIASMTIAEDGALEIVFATNSSYFPEGAGDQLRAFLRTLDKDKSYVLNIQTSLDGTADVSGASDNEAARYNAWLAERRFKRVEAWFLKNGGGLDLTLEPALLENDGSRRVTVRPNALG